MRQEAKEAYALYVETAKRCRLVVPVKGDPWLPNIAARLREYDGLDTWREMLANVERSPFLRGEIESDHPFRANLPWLVKPKNFAKVLSGQYTDCHRAKSKPKSKDDVSRY